jgi:hypothetical protein
MISTPNDFVKQTLMSYYTAMRRLMKKRENRATLPAGHALPAISLTSDNGMWFKPEDYKGRKQILFVFFDSRDPVRAAGTLSLANVLHLQVSLGQSPPFSSLQSKPFS